MKWILITLLSAGLISCKEDDSIEPAILTNGEVSVMLDGEDFFSQYKSGIRISTETPCFPGKMSLFVNYYNQADIERIGFDIFNVPFEPGTYKIHRVELDRQVCSSDTVYRDFYTSVSDGDVNGDFYLPLEEAQNQVTITSHNPSTREVAGTFTITLVIIEEHRVNKTVVGAPDTIRLTDGQFKVRYDLN